MNPWVGIAMVLGGLSLLLILCKQVTRRLNFRPELSRKFIHIGMGILCAGFPLIFENIWPVFLLAGLAISALLVVRLTPLLRTSIGSSLHGVQRFSLGEIYFPLAVAIVWFISIEKPLFYSVSVLVLTLADAFAALIGTRFGQRLFSTRDGHKSWEGSLAFFSTAFLCIFIPLSSLTETGRIESLLIALLIATLVMILEAIAWDGLDNLFLPISVCILLNVYQEVDAEHILWRFLFILLLMTILFSIRSRLKLDDASLLGVSLIIYLAYLIGGWRWTYAPLALFINYLILTPQRKKSSERVHDIHSLVAVASPGLIWLLVYYRHPNESLLPIYSCTFMTELICIYIAQWANQYLKQSLLVITAISSSLGFVMIMLPLLWFSSEYFPFKLIVSSVAIAIVAGLGFIVLQPRIRECPRCTTRWLRQGGIATASSLVLWTLKNDLFMNWQL